MTAAPDVPAADIQGDDLGAELDSLDTGAWGLSVYGRLLPPFPGSEVVPMLAVPPPPPICDTDNEHTRATRVWIAWCGLRKRLGLAPSLLRRLASYRGYPQILRAAERLHAEGIPPAAWFMHSNATWSAAVATQKVRRASPSVGARGGRTSAVARFDACPPLPWILAADRLKPGSAALQAYREHPCLTVAQVHMHHHHRELLDRWFAAQDALMALRLGATLADASAAVGGALGNPAAWAADVQRTRGAVVRAQAHLNAAVARGEWAWR